MQSIWRMSSLREVQNEKCRLQSRHNNKGFSGNQRLHRNEGKNIQREPHMGTKSFNNPRYECETELSKYVWKLKKAAKDYTIKWSMLRRALAYLAGEKHCGLCNEKNCAFQR